MLPVWCIFHKMRNISSWSMHQVERVYGKKIVFFQKNVPYKALGSRSYSKKLKIPNASCKVHINRKRTIKMRKSFKLGHELIRIFMTKFFFFQIDIPYKALGSRRQHKKMKDTECFLPCTYEQLTYHKMRNLSSLGMHKLEIIL